MLLIGDRTQPTAPPTAQTLELDVIADRLIGSDDGGLSLEQRKRTTLGVELAANPSLIFLDGARQGQYKSSNACFWRHIHVARWIGIEFVSKQPLP